MIAEAITFLITLAIFIFSLVIHELSHAYCAYYLGDPTAKNMGRLSLNPIKHLSLVGVLLPIGLYLVGAPMFGFAKPVIYNPVYFKKPRRDMIFVGLAGPFSNMVLAILGWIALCLIAGFHLEDSMSWFYEILGNMMVINLILCFFNLLPIPPLDGSIIYMSSIINKNPELARRFTYYGAGIFVLLVLIMPLVGKATGGNYDVVGFYIKWCFSKLLSIMHFTD